MRHKISVLVAERVAKERVGGMIPDMRNMTVVPTRKVVQLTDGVCDAVVTSGTKGTFIIRRRKDRLSNSCPLFCCEIRRIDVGGHSGQSDRSDHEQATEGRSGDEGMMTHRPVAAAASACAYHIAPRDRDRDERGTP